MVLEVRIVIIYQREIDELLAKVPFLDPINGYIDLFTLIYHYVLMIFALLKAIYTVI